MQASQLLIVAFLILAGSTAKAVVGPVYHEQPDDTPKAEPAKTEPVKTEPVKTEPVKTETPKAVTAPTEPAPAPAPTESNSGSVDQIKGIGQFKFGAKVTDFPTTLLQIVDPRAKGILLRVSPYGTNYLVTDVKNLTWGGLPLKGLVLTFHDNVLIDFQIAFKGKRGDLYVVNKAFKDKYGPSDATTLPIETWTGSKIQVTLMFPASQIFDAKSVDAPGQGRVELLDLAQWKKFEAVRAAELKKILEQRYEAASQKAKNNL